MATPLKQVRFAVKNVFHSPPSSPNPRQAAFSFGAAMAAGGAPPGIARTAPFPVPSTAPATRTKFFLPPLAYPPAHVLQSPSVRQTLFHPEIYSAGPRTPTVASVPSKFHPHPLLSRQLVDYDLRDHPMALTYRGYPLSVPTLSEPATTPPLPYLSLKCVYLPKHIKVYAANGSFVTLNDIFYAVYNALRASLTEADYYAIPSSSDQKRTVRAYEKRYRRMPHPSSYEEEKRAGMKFVDLLLEHVEFAGISRGHKPDEWYLHVR